MQWIGRGLAVLFVVAVPVFLLSSNVRWAFDDPRVYELGFSRHNVQGVTGFSQEELSQIAREIRDYFDSPDEWLRITVGGGQRELFNSREVLHMRDVKDLQSKTFLVQEGAAIYFLLFVSLGFLIRKDAFGRSLARLLLLASGLTVGLVTAVAAIAVVGFEALFRAFHLVSFSNDFWQGEGYLVELFPTPFWLEGTLLLGLATVVEAGVIAALVGFLLLWNTHRTHLAQRRAPQVV